MKQIINEHRNYWRQIRMLSVLELKKTYKGSFLGMGWAVIKPAFTLFILWFAFDIGIRANSLVDGYPRFVFLMTGYVPWFFMSDCIISGVRAMRLNRQFVTKISFPVSAINTFIMLSKLYVHLLLAALMYITLIIMGYPPQISNIQFFIYCPLMFMFFLALSWTTSMLGAYSRDFENAINSVITGLFWLSGIIWSTKSVNVPGLDTFLLLNPINFFANGYRKVFLTGEWFWQDPLELAVFLAEFVLLIFLGAHCYKKYRRNLSDIL